MRCFITALPLCWLLPALTQGSVIKTERSMYRNIRIEEQGGLRCLQFSLTKTSKNQSCINLNHPEHLVFAYSRMLLGSLLLNSHPRHILLIGLGGGTLSNTLHTLLPDSVIHNVELDPAVVRVARHYFGFKESERVSVFTQDGRIFVKRAVLQGKRYDLIILDAFNGDYIPEHLMTREFLLETRQLLNDKGVLAANTFSTSKLYDHESVTYQSVFGQFIHIKAGSTSNRVILAPRDGLPASETLDANAQQLDRQLKTFNVDIFKIRSLMKTQPDWDPSARVLTDQYSPANLLRSTQ